jgi:hypothetical protein
MWLVHGNDKYSYYKATLFSVLRRFTRGNTSSVLCYDVVGVSVVPR